MVPSPQKRVLILSASVGGGRVRAAEAIEAAMRQSAPGAAVRHIDVLALANRTFRKIYGRWYLGFAETHPTFWGTSTTGSTGPKTATASPSPTRCGWPWKS